MPDQPLEDLAALPEGYFYCVDDAACLGEDRLSEAEYTDALPQTFDRIDRALHPHRLGRSQMSNDTGALSSEQSYILRAYFDVFAATGNVEIMKRAARHVKNVLERLDDVTGATDYRGVSGPTWRTTGFSSAPMAFLVTDGQIASSIAEFARIVLATPSLQDELTDEGLTLRDFANTVLDRVEETIAHYESTWDVKEKLYRVPADAAFLSFAGRSVPLNWEAAMARAMTSVYRARGGAALKRRLEDMAAHFKSNWVRKTDNTVYWTYWADTSRTIEDISHAHLNVNWMLEAWQGGILFSYSEVVTVSVSFARNVIKRDRTFSYFLDGTGTREPVTTAVLWLPLSIFDSRIYQASWSFSRAAAADPTKTSIAFNGSRITELLGGAHLLRYRADLLGSREVAPG
jgi:hypothetical protein